MSYIQSISCFCSWRSAGTGSSAGPAGELKSGNCDPNPLRIQCKKPILSCFVRTKGKFDEPCNGCLLSLKFRRLIFQTPSHLGSCSCCGY